MQPLEATLQAYHLNALQEIADVLTLKPDQRPPRKAWLVTELGKLIPKMAQSEVFIHTLTDAERAALAILCTSEDTMTLAQVARPLMLAGIVRIDGQPESRHRPWVKDVLTDLLHKGLIVNVITPSGGSTMRTLTLLGRFGIPEEVRNVLPVALLPHPSPDPDLVMADSIAPHRVVSRELQSFLRELLFVWSELRDQSAQPLKAGGIGKRDRRRLAHALSLIEPEGLEWVTWVYQVLAALGLVSESDTITAVEGQAVTLFWSAGATQHRRDLRQAYGRITTPLSQDRAALRLTGYLQGLELRSPDTVREAILTALEQTASLGWLSFSTFLSLLTGDQAGSLIIDSSLLTVVYDQLHWYGNAYRREVENTLKGIERTLVQCALEELGRMGLAELGYSQDDPKVLSALRATQVPGQAAQTPSPAAPNHREQPWQMILQPDFQLLALGPVPLRVLAGVEQIAHREKLDESVVTYRLTREAVYRAMRTGETVASITAYLEETTGLPVPQNIERSLDEWYRQYERIVIRRRVRILQVDDADRLTTLLDDPQLGQHLHPIDDRSAWFVPDDTDLVQQRLQALALLPATSHGPQADLPSSMRWCDEELASRTALPSLYVTSVLARFAEPHGSHWRLTPHTVKVATALGMPTLEIVTQLRTLTGSSLPDGLEKRLKAWGKHYGDGQTAVVRLLRLKRSTALADLRAADPALHRWLRPLPGVANLAVVNEAHWDEVMGLLASWGVDVDSEHWW